MRKDIIIGAGITGLAAAHATGATIYEASDTAGGICRSYSENGYRFENGGGHWIFKMDSSVRKYLEHFAILAEYERHAGIHINKIFDYPLQKTLRKDGLVESGTLKEWLLIMFGRELGNLFFYPFHKKYTDGLYSSIIQDEAYKSPQGNDKGYNDTFSYPVGGLDKMIIKMARGYDIQYGKKLVGVELNQKIAHFSDGSMVKYGRMISTIPLNDLLHFAGVDNKGLASTPVHVLNLGGDVGREGIKKHWLYIPHCKSGFYRVGFYNNVDSSFAPKDKVSLYVERSSVMSDDSFVDDMLVVKELKDLGFIGDVDTISSNWIPCAYTWLYRNHKREEHLKMLESFKVLSIGRYGKWKFQGIAESIRDGLNV